MNANQDILAYSVINVHLVTMDILTNLESVAGHVAAVVTLIHHLREAVTMKLELVSFVPTIPQAPTVNIAVTGGMEMLSTRKTAEPALVTDVVPNPVTTVMASADVRQMLLVWIVTDVPRTIMVSIVVKAAKCVNVA